MTTATGEITHNITEILVRRYDFNLHDRLKEYRISLFGRSLEPDGTGNLECHF